MFFFTGWAMRGWLLLADYHIIQWSFQRGSTELSLGPLLITSLLFTVIQLFVKS